MKVLVVHDSLTDVPDTGDLPEDFGAEYDDESVVLGILRALERGGHSAEHLALGEDFVARIRSVRPDIVFNIAEGIRGRGRESLVPAWLDHLGIPHTGSDAVALGVSLDKDLSKLIACASGIHTPPFRLIKNVDELKNIDLQFPLFLKPVAEGSSMGIRKHSVAKTEEELRAVAEWILSQYRQGCLVEEFAPGREFCVGILGNQNPEMLPVAEISTHGDFYSYELKTKHQKKITCPANIAEAAAKQMREMATEIYSAIGCRDLARVDFKLDRNRRPSFLEINPLPGLSEEYGIFPEQARASGICYHDLINNILSHAIKRTSKENAE